MLVCLLYCIRLLVWILVYYRLFTISRLRHGLCVSMLVLFCHLFTASSHCQRFHGCVLYLWMIVKFRYRLSVPWLRLFVRLWNLFFTLIISGGRALF